MKRISHELYQNDENIFEVYVNYWFRHGAQRLKKENTTGITKIKCKEFVNEVKEIAKTSQLTTHAVLGVVTAKTDMNIASQLPPINQLKRIVQHTRKQISSAPPNPATLSDLSIPDEYKKSVSGESFLLYDSFEDNVDNK
ncbi:uncharacterized protein LOC132927779 [Rhopalosiphum padi]|uniref:uncharacterized protein LOC132927779 n=1 Tax=Rhopalosiphum padi TaxID=40932 RepID=UPI00298E3C1A|nr:uncharacterized protein LOC132927779 [Rhopalosiphum padi]